ncbi:transporter [Cloacibacterium rupense]|uniref:Transporter n=1 Tax=Cloacibacterium rupense TaxID=517423 RepID=A0ABQ2NNA0_9FLAO|nr:TolC family protein [Cloacibacterium rupense]GGP05889.1 transporter [Cloacibacterium rupense]
MNKWIKIFAITAISTQMHAQQSFTMEQALQYAYENNVNVKKAKIDQTIADKKVKETIGIGLPQIDLNGSYNYFLNIPVQLLPGELVGQPAGTYIPVQFGQKQSATGGVSVSQLLFNGSYIVGLESSRAYREMSALATEKTVFTIKEAIMMSYAAVLVTDENIKTLEENNKVSGKILNETRETYKAGLIELQNVEQLEYSYKNLVTNLENLKRTKQKYVNALKYLIGYPQDEELQLLTSMEELIQKNQILVDHSAQVDLTNHIDLKLKENALRISELQLKYQKSKSLPSLSAALSSSYNGFSNKFTFFDREQQWFNTSVFALQLNVPVFSGLQRSFQTQQAKLEVEKAKLDKDDAEKQLKSDYFGKVKDYENAYDSFKTSQDLVKLSSEIYRKQNVKFKEGLGTSFELSQSETQLFQAQSQFYLSALDLVKAKIALDKAKGTL